MLSMFVLKIIAVITMIIDHTIDFFPMLKVDATMALGRVAFPIFALGVAEGCYYTKDKRKYLLRLLIFALVSQIPYALFITEFTGCGFLESGTNVGFTFLLSVLAIFLIQKENINIVLKIFGTITSMIMAILLDTDYSIVGVICVLGLYILREKRIMQSIFVIILFTMYICIIAKVPELIVTVRSEIHHRLFNFSNVYCII